jgi:TonB family protein
MRVEIVAMGSLVAVLVPSIALAAQPDTAPLTLAASSKWEVNYDDDSCRLSRLFGEGEDRVAFFLERYGPGDMMAMTVAGRPLEGDKSGEMTIRFGPGEAEARVSPLYGELKEFAPAIIVTHVEFAPLDWQRAGMNNEDAREAYRDQTAGTPTDVFGQEISPAREAAVEWLALDRKGARPILLELGSMGRPMEAMRACTDELLTHWGIDVEKHRHLARGVHPATNPGKWLTPSDYPTGLLRRGMEGVIQFRLSVDEQGKPTACHIQQSTRPAEFDRAVCNGLMRRAKFEPAIGADGQPVASYWRSSARFEIGH